MLIDFITNLVTLKSNISKRMYNCVCKCTSVYVACTCVISCSVYQDCSKDTEKFEQKIKELGAL